MYEIYLDTPTGERVMLLDSALSFAYVLAANRIGVWTVTLPDILPDEFIRPDAIVEFWRAGKLECAGLLRTWDYEGLADAKLTLTGFTFLYLLDSRIVAYAAGESESAKTDYADDMIKAVIRENLGSSATDTDRDLSSAGLTVQADSSQGAIISRRFAWRNVLQTCQAFAEESTQAGTRLYFDLVPYWAGDTLGVEFKTFVGQRGNDRSYDAHTPVVFGEAFGNLDNPRLQFEYGDERNYVYAGGQGLGDLRLVEEQSDSDRIAVSPWNRREIFASMTNEQTSTELQSIGKATLDGNKPKLRFTADLISTLQTTYGTHWGWGDKVPAEFRGRTYTGHIDTVRVSMTSAGKEQIAARLEVLE